MTQIPPSTTVVEEPKSGIALISALFIVGGAGLGWLIKAGAGWVADLPWAPFQGPLRLINEITGAEPVSTIAALVVGAVAGAVVAVVSMADILQVTVSSDSVALKRGSKEQMFKRSAISTAYMDGKHLVLVGGSGEELAREKTDLRKADFAEAFHERGFHWSDDDPFATEFRRWVPDTPGLPPGADALFKAREKAMKDRDESDVSEMRSELAKLGVVVRDQDNRQYWRLVDRGRVDD